MTLTSINICIDKLDDVVVNEYNNACSTTKMRPADVKSSSYIDFEVKSNDLYDPKFEACDHVRTSKYFCKTLQSKLIWRRFLDPKSQKHHIMEIYDRIP